MGKISLEQMKNLSLDDLIELYKSGYRLDDGKVEIKDTKIDANFKDIKDVNFKDIEYVNFKDIEDNKKTIQSQSQSIDYIHKLAKAIDPIIDPTVNFGKVIVSTGHSSSDTNITLATGNGSKLPDPSTSGQYNLVWWNSTDYSDPTDDPNKEIVRVTSKIGDNINILRGQEETTPSNKNSPNKTYRMINAITAKTIADIQTDSQTRVNTGVSTHSSVRSGTHGVVGDITGTTDTQTLRNKMITDTSNYVLAKYLQSLTSTIDISTAPAPSTGQVLTAISPTSASWQTLAAPTCFFVSILGSPSSGPFPLTVSFNSTVIGGVGPFIYSWSFGDGGVSTNPAPNHNYTVNGTYTASLTVTDSIGNTATSATTITVTTGVGIVASGLGMSESMLLPDFLAGIYNAGPGLSENYSIIDSLAGFYNAGPLLSDDTLISLSTAESTTMISSITIPSNTSVSVGGYTILTPSCYLYGTLTLCPILTWTSSNTFKATVDSTGKVTGVAAGNTTITAYAGPTTSTLLSNTCNVTVSL